MDFDTMTKEQLREAARQYAQELMAQGSEIEPFMLGEADVQVQSEPDIQTDSETVVNIGAEPEIRINTEPLIKVESEPDTVAASDTDPVADAEPVITILHEASEVPAEEPVWDRYVSEAAQEPASPDSEPASEPASEPETQNPEPAVLVSAPEPAVIVSDTEPLMQEPDGHEVPLAAPSHKSDKPAHKKGLFGRGKKESKEMQELARKVADNSDRYGLSNQEIAADGPSIDLTKLKKNDLLEIMLRQSEEIDSLRAEVADLKSQLQSKEIKIATSGSIAEASLKLSKIFEEAQYAADLYLANIRKETDKKATEDLYFKGADYDE